MSLTRSVLASSLAALALAAVLVARGVRSVGAAPVPASEREILAADIAFHARRAARDPMGAADRAMLATLYLRRARESSDWTDWVRAERAARASLGIRSGRNVRAMLVLASSLLGQHRFAEARTAAEALVDADPRPSARALLGEIQLELGDYRAARRTFRALRSEEPNLAVAPRLARWAEIEGRVDEAHAILVRARGAAVRRPDLPREQVAWFALRVADLGLRHGRLREAQRAALGGLEARPGDPRLLSLMARWHATGHRWSKARAWARRIDTAAMDLQTLALLGDAEAALGDSAAASRAWAEVERRARANPEPFNRQWTQFRLDHRIALDSTRAVLEREIRERPDVLGWRMLAQARLLTGDTAAAREAREKANDVIGDRHR